jgi:hypothetical protein
LDLDDLSGLLQRGDVLFEGGPHRRLSQSPHVQVQSGVLISGPPPVSVRSPPATSSSLSGERIRSVSRLRESFRRLGFFLFMFVLFIFVSAKVRWFYRLRSHLI